MPPWAGVQLLRFMRLFPSFGPQAINPHEGFQMKHERIRSIEFRRRDALRNNAGVLLPLKPLTVVLELVHPRPISESAAGHPHRAVQVLRLMSDDKQTVQVGRT
jgi:hypothetical protein